MERQREIERVGERESKRMTQKVRSDGAAWKQAPGVNVSRVVTLTFGMYAAQKEGRRHTDTAKLLCCWGKIQPRLFWNSFSVSTPIRYHTNHVLRGCRTHGSQGGGSYRDRTTPIETAQTILAPVTCDLRL